MEFEFSAIFRRSVTIELKNKDIVYTRPYTVYLDGKEVLDGKENVFTLNGLKPDTDYRVRIVQDGEEAEDSFRTERESTLLDVRDFGAAGDGVHDDTGAIQAAITACPEEGTVYLPEGVYSSRPVFLKSGIALWIGKGAVLLGDPDRNHYPILPGVNRKTGTSGEYSFATWEGNPYASFASLLTAVDAENIDIFGEGIVDGNAENGDWWVKPKVMRTAWRGNTIFLSHCRNVRLQGITVQNSPSWTIHPFYSDYVAAYSIRIQNPPDSPNTDGFDPECCDGVLLLGVTISVGDDCIAIKSGKYYMSKEHHKPADHFMIRNSVLERGHGSVTVGSEAAAGCQNVTVEQCLFSGTDRGLRIKTRRGRGPKAVYDSIFFHDIVMKDVHMPFTVNMFYFCDPDGHTDYVQSQDPAPVDDRTPKIGMIRAENIVSTGADACVLAVCGLPEMPVGHLLFRHVTAEFKPAAERKPRQTLMMDNFPDMTGIPVYAKNVSCLELEDFHVKGGDRTEPELVNVEKYEAKGVSFEN